jgi:hypothetical protein
MTPHLTATGNDPVLDAAIRATKPGMAFWSGTAADTKAVCGNCKFHGAPPSRHKRGSEYSARCALYRKFAGKDGKPVPASTRGCKYFESR